MLVYQPQQSIDPSSLVDVGHPSDLGGRVVEGEPRISARVDYHADGMIAGLFEATTGIVEIRFPFT